MNLNILDSGKKGSLMDKAFKNTLMDANIEEDFIMVLKMENMGYFIGQMGKYTKEDLKMGLCMEKVF